MVCAEEMPLGVTSARYDRRTTQTTSVGTRYQKSLKLKESYGNGGDSFLAHPSPTSFTFPRPPPAPALRCASGPSASRALSDANLRTRTPPSLTHADPVIWGLFVERPCSLPTLCKQNDISFIYRWNECALINHPRSLLLFKCWVILINCVSLL